MSHDSPKVVAIGGGHGLAATIRAIREYAGRATAVVATADDGGSTGRLRSAMTLPAPGDLRRCLVAMAGAEDEALGQAFEHRFWGTDIEGHALGNLVLAGLTAVTGDFLAAANEAGRLLGLDPAHAQVLPATTEPVVLHARTTDGDAVSGQVAVWSTEGIAEVSLDPPGVKAPSEVAEAILDADQVVLGPGDLYTSVLAAAVVEDIRCAVAETVAKRIYICNLHADGAETLGYDVADHLAALYGHGVRPDVVVVQENGSLVLGDLEADVEILQTDVARPHGRAHDSAKLALTLQGLVPSP